MSLSDNYMVGLAARECFRELENDKDKGFVFSDSGEYVVVIARGPWRDALLAEFKQRLTKKGGADEPAQPGP